MIIYCDLIDFDSKWLEEYALYTRLLHEGPHPVSDVGGKAASLSRLIAWNVRVPSGFVVTASAHRNFLEHHAIDPMHELAGEHIANAEIPPHIASDISRSLEMFEGSYRFAVRSSGLFEDSEQASFAGQYETYLDIGREAVLHNIKRCWASMSATHAQSYAARQGISSHKHLMGVVVQALIQADVAGVSFSIHPVTGANTIVINASYGLGESVVSGMVTPDAFEVDKGTATIRKMIGSKECQIRLSPEGGTQTLDTARPLREVFSLSDAQVLAISQLTNQLEQFARCPVDVEWAIENDSLYCLQMRPITFPK